MSVDVRQTDEGDIESLYAFYAAINKQDDGYFETVFAKDCVDIGISVGLTIDFGPAQRLYCKLGYMPDGNGVTLDREFVDDGQPVTVNDDLCLMMVKEL